MIRVLLVDDEEPARERLRQLLSSFDDFEVVGEAGDGEQALEKISQAQPDLIFLDIQMPARSGIEVAASLPSPRPGIIFCTAFDQHAIRAFELHAVDYLLKPVSRTRLAEALAQVRNSPAKNFDSALKKLMVELESAKKVQAQLFPQTLPPMKTLDYMGMSKAAREVGGDYYDFLQLREHQLCIALGDISGKSISAALLMASLQALLRSHAPLYGTAVGELLADVNRLMCSSTDSDRYATLFCGLYEDARRTLTYVNAGHNAPMLFRAARTPGEQVSAFSQAETAAEATVEAVDSTVVMRLETGGTAVGMFQNASYQQETVRMFPGDLLLIFSDGITEAVNSNGEEFGEVRLSTLAASHQQLSAAALSDLILKQLDQFVGEAPPHDDLTLVVAKII